jgi:hypothetical protein
MKFKETEQIFNFKFKDLFKYNTFFTYILDPDFNIEIPVSEIDEVTLPELKELLLHEFNDELEENKRIIGKCIFTPEIYNEHAEEINRNFFVEYPINLAFKDINDKIYGFNMIEVPIFNRIFIKYENINYCVIPINSYRPSQLLQDFIDRESLLMNPITFRYINTSIYHTEGGIGAGGNIHCLSKQIFIT